MLAKSENKRRAAVARSESLTPGERSAIARKAAQARWSGEVNTATHTGDLQVGELVLSCAVLNDERRVLSQRAISRALNRRTGGDDYRRQIQGEARLPGFLSPKALAPFISDELRAALVVPIFYREAKNPTVAYGVEAQLLPQICNVWLRARDAGTLTKTQLPIAAQAELLVRGFAEVGIVALVDEATGYQRSRASNALAKILEAFIDKELQVWVRTFPPDYYEELFRLRGLDYLAETPKRPQYFGVLTNDIVYKRIAPGVLEELRKVVPRNDYGRPTAKLFQRLTVNIGYPKLREHLGAVVAVMKLSSDYHDFLEKLDRLYPRFAQQLTIPLEYEQSIDDGKGM